MAYTTSIEIPLGSSQTGLLSSLRAALQATDGTIHASLRDISTGFLLIQGSLYAWSSSSIPAGYRGRVVFYTGTLGGSATDFSGVTVKSSASLNPQESEGTGLSLAVTGLDLVTVDGVTLPVSLAYIAAIAAGKVSGAGTGTEVFKGLDGTTTRLTITVDSSGNRISVVYG